MPHANPEPSPKPIGVKLSEFCRDLGLKVLLVRAPGAETPTPIPGCLYWRREAYSSSNSDANLSKSNKIPNNRFFSPKLGAGAIAWGHCFKIKGRCYRLGRTTRTRLPNEYSYPGIGVGVSAPGARTSNTSKFTS